MRERLKSIAKWLGAGAGLAAGAYGAYVVSTWYRYGSPSQPSREDEDKVLDGFMPKYDVVERHHVPVGASAAVTLTVAKEMELTQLPVVSAIFKTRELILGSTPDQHRDRGVSWKKPGHWGGSSFTKALAGRS